MKVMKEIQLITLARRGETDAYRTLVERYQAGVIIHCDRMVSDRDLAEDIAQETFVKAYYSLGRYDDAKGAFSTWLYQIATNQTKDYLRAHHQAIPLDSDIDIPGHTDTLTEAEKHEIRQAVSRLEPPEYAAVIAAYYWEGKRYEEIAAAQHVPVATIGTWIRRAKQQLRKELS